MQVGACVSSSLASQAMEILQHWAQHKAKTSLISHFFWTKCIRFLAPEGDLYANPHTAFFAVSCFCFPCWHQSCLQSPAGIKLADEQQHNSQSQSGSQWRRDMVKQNCGLRTRSKYALLLWVIPQKENFGTSPLGYLIVLSLIPYIFTVTGTFLLLFQCVPN